jgi:hypothetical protein
MKHAVLFATFGFALTVCASPWLEIQSEQAARVGIDYRHASKRAYAGHEEGLTTMFRVTPALDGGGAEGHSHDLQKLLTMYGDAWFAALLHRESIAVRQSVIDSLDFAFELYAVVQIGLRSSRRLMLSLHIGWHVLPKDLTGRWSRP